MRLNDETHGLRNTELERVSLKGQALADLAEFWENAARVDAKRAIASESTDEDFETSGMYERDALRPLIRPGDRVLEIGCGIGRVLQHIAPFCAEAHGVDISREMVERGRERLADIPNVFFHVGNGYDLGEFEDGTFDVVYSPLVFQHMPRTVFFNYLLETRRVLREGGTFWFQVPNILDDAHFAAFRHFTQPYYVQHPYPMYFFTPAEVCALLVRAGFRVVSLDEYMIVQAMSANPGIEPEVQRIVARSGALLTDLTTPEDGLINRINRLELRAIRFATRKAKGLARRMRRGDRPG